ncbi:hypothetical protein C7S20_02515 [Christiangramia fulva]|uniref:Uncharacterized protein n=1 Tax=Christiangramia fulva TaxID=2126553 RepID=A0A2R3Z1U8_9FLAO|nr:hypothetical protein [Christiangramia fulva]AVR44224.1 hypothetical protein C7S20_02515 [Christiangramia fulva]
MKSFSIYRSIRQKALLYGLPLERFAILMSSVILSLLVVIFSFGFMAVVFCFFWNTALYFSLLRLKTFRSGMLTGKGIAFISCKQLGLGKYAN